MPYTKIITASTTWVCPKKGEYKVIAVGRGTDGSASGIGGAGEVGMIVASFEEGQSVSCTLSTTTVVIGSTVFGSYLTSPNGTNRGLPLPDTAVSAYDACAFGGEGGYTLDGKYGGAGGCLISYTDQNGGKSAAVSSPTANGGYPGLPGYGYGAGGGINYAGATPAYTAGKNGVIVIQAV